MPHVRDLFLLAALGVAACGSDAKHPNDDGDEPPPDGVDGGSMQTLDGSAAHRDAAAAARDGGASLSDASVHTDAAVNGGVDGAIAAAGDAGPVTASSPWLDDAPRATCSAGDKVDGTISGLNGDYNCNLTIQGQVEAPHFLSTAWLDDCAYVNGPDSTSVIHVSETGVPTVTTTLSVVGFQSDWESMKASETSRLLAGYESNGATLSIYDLSKDCKAPVFMSSTQLGGLLGSIGHAGNFSPDGTIYYASSMYTSGIYAVDLAVPQTPTVITSTFDRSAHDLSIGKAGNRGYFANPNLTMFGVGSFAIIDTTDVQARKPNAKGTLISELSWPDGNISQYPIPITYQGRDHLLITEELGSGSCDDPTKPHWGYAHMFDISDEKAPKLLSIIRTQAQDPKNCKAAGDAAGGVSGFGYGTHYCNVDRLDDPRVAACGNWDAGLRVYDIRDPARPKEVAYFDTSVGNMPGRARIVPEKGEIWIAMEPSTFYVLKITPGSTLAQILAE